MANQKKSSLHIIKVKNKLKIMKLKGGNTNIMNKVNLNTNNKETCMAYLHICYVAKTTG